MGALKEARGYLSSADYAMSKNVTETAATFAVMAAASAMIAMVEEMVERLDDIAAQLERQEIRREN